jgi:hypothetical protein
MTMIDRYDICTSGEVYKCDSGEWLMYDEAQAQLDHAWGMVAKGDDDICKTAYDSILDKARIAELEAALQEIASYGNMNDKVGWAVQAARKALKLAK